VTDYQQGVIWRVPPRGGQPQIWLASRRLDGESFGTAGLLLGPDHHTLYFDQASNAGLGGGDPVGGELFSVQIEPDGQPGPLREIWQSPPTALPDGFSLSQSGDIYMPEVGLTEQVVELSPAGKLLDSFGQIGTGANGSPIPFDSPSGTAFLGTKLVIANQSALLANSAHQALLELETGQQGAPIYVPADAGPLQPSTAKHRHKRHRSKRHARHRKRHRPGGGDR
jgi:sugar lactone lactonase YvrE